MRSIKPLEDLIIAILFSKSEIIKTKSGKMLNFTITARKIPLFHSYIHHNKIESHVLFDKTTMKGSIKHSIILEKIIREWTTAEKVTGIDPRKVSQRTFLLWICLFARKAGKSVAIDTNLSDLIQEDISYYFGIYFNTTLYSKGTAFYIKPFHIIIEHSIQKQRPAVENVELNYLLPKSEEVEFKRKMAEREEELFPNGYQN